MPQYIENFLHALNIAYSNLIKNEAHSENLTGKFKNPKNFENASCFCNEVRKAIICFEKRNSMDTPPVLATLAIQRRGIFTQARRNQIFKSHLSNFCKMRKRCASLRALTQSKRAWIHTHTLWIWLQCITRKSRRNYLRI